MMTNTQSIYSNGPDMILNANSFTSTKLDQPVKLRLGEIDYQKYVPISIYTMFKKTAEARPNHKAICFKTSSSQKEWACFTYEEYWKIANKAAKSFIKLGLGVSECVAIIGFNSPHWFSAILGAIFAGGIGCGIYTTNTPEACQFILEDSKSEIVVVENQQQLEKILKSKDKCPLKKVIQYTGKIENRYNDLVISWKEFIDFGNDVDNSILDMRIKTIAPNKCASLIYTSGTTGNPKAAMISHDNITYVVRHLGDLVKLKPFHERIISYLPLSHIAAQALDLFCPLAFGITIYFAQPDALKGSLNKTMVEVKPTFFFGVPRVFEKIQENIEKVTNNLTGFKLKLYLWSRRVASEHVLTNFDGLNKTSASFQLARKLIVDANFKKLGLDQCRYFYSGAAPITKDTLDFFHGLGMPLCEAFGMTEATGPHNVGQTNMNSVCSIGKIGQLNRSKLFNKDKDGSGELCVYGRHVFMGFLNNYEKTQETFDDQGWLHTGDIAKIDPNGYLFITGRLKELIITAGGENIPPVIIEDNIKSELPDLISNAMLVGDKKKYLVVLITLKCKINLDTMEPLDELSENCIKYLRNIGSKSSCVSEIVNNQDKLVYKAIENGIKKANEKSISRAAKVQKFNILPRDFSLTHGELGPTLKLRRPIVAKMYQSVIDELYQDSGDSKNE